MLKELHAGNGAQRKHLPVLLDRFETTDHRVGLIFRHIEESQSLYAIRERPEWRDGVYRKHMVWMLSRILSAAGNAGVVFDPAKTDIHMQGVLVCRAGLAAPFSEPELKAKLDEPDCHIRLTLRGTGKGAARFWTCDLTEGYIQINASYRT